MTTTTVEVRPADVSRFDDVAAVLDPNGNDRACWCLAYRLRPGDNSALVGEQRAERTRGLCAAEPAPGLLAYVDGVAVGWCGTGPRAGFERLARSRTIPTPDDVPVWSVVCFVVRSDFRRRGVAGALLAGAVEHARAHGAPALEGYPVDPGGERINAGAAHVGTTGLFEAAGFRRVLRTQSRSGGVPRWLMRLDLGTPARPS